MYYKVSHILILFLCMNFFLLSLVLHVNYTYVFCKYYCKTSTANAYRYEFILVKLDLWFFIRYNQEDVETQVENINQCLVDQLMDRFNSARWDLNVFPHDNYVRSVQLRFFLILFISTISSASFTIWIAFIYNFIRSGFLLIIFFFQDRK